MFVDLSSIIEFLQTNQLFIIAILAIVQTTGLILLLSVWYTSRKRYKRLFPLLERADLAQSISAEIRQQQQRLKEIESFIQSLRDAQGSLEQKQIAAIQQIGFYRYNAFPDTGGELSFSLALLDGQKEGFVLTSLYGRQEARVYAKQVKKDSVTRFSAEEQEAIRCACSGK
ncbi:MAG TPA: hypothetical protein DDZ53_02795 [Firmicutes bacterium]|nr:hypothetical protein [Bacillota bacterium]